MRKFLFYLLVFALTNNMVYGWEKDVSKNTQITPTGLFYLENDVKTNQNGITYIFMLCGGENVSMRLQIVDSNGNRLLSRGGELISQEPNRSWFGLNQYIELDKEGNAFIGVQDYRENVETEKLTYSIYKYTETGEKILDGIVLNNGIGYKSANGLSMCATDDGGCVCAYQYTDPEQNQDFIIAEKINKDGISLWKKILYQCEEFTYPYPFLTDAGNNRVLALITTGEGEIKSQIILPDGTLEKEEPETVYTEGFASPKIWEAMRVEELSSNKTMVAMVDGMYLGRILVINNDGTIGLDGSSTGIQISDSNYASGIPAVSYNEEDDTYTCFYKMFDIDFPVYSSLWLQKINGADGSNLWAEPKELLAFQQESEYGYYVMRNAGEGRSALFFMKMDADNYLDVKVYTQLLGNDGEILTSPIPVSTALSTKQTLRVSNLVEGQFITAWDDKRTSQMSLFMQNVRLDEISSIKNEEWNEEDTYEKIEYFSISGVKLNTLQKGINLIRVTKGDDVKTIKVIR